MHMKNAKFPWISANPVTNCVPLQNENIYLYAACWLYVGGQTDNN